MAPLRLRNQSAELKYQKLKQSLGCCVVRRRGLMRLKHSGLPQRFGKGHTPLKRKQWTQWLEPEDFAVFSQVASEASSGTIAVRFEAA